MIDAAVCEININANMNNLREVNADMIFIQIIGKRNSVRKAWMSGA